MFYRAFLMGGPTSVKLPEPEFRVYDLVPTGAGEYWYAAENRDPCHTGPSTCIIDTPRAIVTKSLFTAPGLTWVLRRLCGESN